MNQTYNLLAIVALGLGLELVYAYKIKTDKKRHEKLDKQYQEEFNKTKKQLQKIASSTKKESLELMSKSLGEFNKIQKELEEMTAQIRDKTKVVTNELVEWQKSNLDNQIRLYQHDMAEHTKQSIKLIDKAGKSEIVRLGNSLHESISKTHREIIKALILSSQDADKEIQAFKKSQKKRITKQPKK